MHKQLQIVHIQKTGNLPSLRIDNAVQGSQVAELMEGIPYLKTVFEIPHCKKMQRYKNAYRIRSGEYRIGFFRTNDAIELVRILPRKEIYRSFP